MARLFPIHWRDLIKIFENFGCSYVRKKGSHRKLPLHPFKSPHKLCMILYSTQSSSSSIGAKPLRMVFSVTHLGSRNWIR